MQKKAAHAGFGCAVEPVAGDRVADAGEMDADLMRAAGANADFEESELSQAAEDAEFGVGGAAFVQAGGHAGAADGVAGDLGVDGACVWRDASVDQRDVGLLHGPCGKLTGEIAMGGVGAGD